MKNCLDTIIDSSYHSLWICDHEGKVIGINKASERINGLEYPSCELRCAYFLREFFHTHISAEQVAALIVEPILGEGGFVVPPKEYFKVPI